MLRMIMTVIMPHHLPRMRMIPHLLLIRLPLRRPPHQLVPIPTPMLRPEPLDPTNLVILDLDRRVRLAHECVPEQIDAMTDMRRRGHHREIFFDDFAAIAGGLEGGPVAFADAVLGVFEYVIQGWDREGGLTRQWS